MNMVRHTDMKCMLKQGGPCAGKAHLLFHFFLHGRASVVVRIVQQHGTRQHAIQSKPGQATSDRQGRAKVNNIASTVPYK
jgi:hypothetical protein